MQVRVGWQREKLCNACMLKQTDNTQDSERIGRASQPESMVGGSALARAAAACIRSACCSLVHLSFQHEHRSHDSDRTPVSLMTIPSYTSTSTAHKISEYNEKSRNLWNSKPYRERTEGETQLSVIYCISK